MADAKSPQPCILQDERFNRAIDLQTGYKTYSILCMPIVDSNSDVVGVAQIINKCSGEKDNIESHKFTEQDILVFKKYLMFCGIGITNAQLFQLSMQEYRCNRVSHGYFVVYLFKLIFYTRI